MGNIVKSMVLTAVLCAGIHASAQNSGAARVDKYQAGSQYLAYPVPGYGVPELTAAPKGYEPFHIEHYGRHGSRWLLKDDKYSEPVDYLKKAAKRNKLTERGKALLAQLKEIKESAKNRVGELTPLGHRQHRDIARRMTENFPQVFHRGTYVDAKSTVVIRCILSMHNEVAEMERLVPGIITKADASRATQKLLAYNSNDTVAKELSRSKRHLVDEYEKKHSDYTEFSKKLFNDQMWVEDNLDIDDVFDAVFDVAVNTQSHDDQEDFYDVFTEEELRNKWLSENAWWYIYGGDTKLTNNRVHFMQRYLLRNLIESADTAMTSLNNSVNLRFGHESIVLPLAVLMELNNSAFDTENLDDLEANWRNYEIFPMGSNIQMIFYRPKKVKNPSIDDVLVKVLLNEAEVKLPGEPVSGPYYRWADLRKHYLDKLGTVE